MEVTTTPQSTTSKGARSSPPLNLEALATKSFAELDAIYREGVLPSSIHALDGDLTGRVLAARGLDGPLFAPVLRTLEASPYFPWRGKHFSAGSDRTGDGVNRISVPIVLGRQHLFFFSTRFEPSLIDARETIVLDYEHPENPPYIRKIHDELREVSPGVFLGPAMWKITGSAVTFVWFALAAEGGVSAKA